MLKKKEKVQAFEENGFSVKFIQRYNKEYNPLSFKNKNTVNEFMVKNQNIVIRIQKRLKDRHEIGMKIMPTKPRG